MRNSQEAANVNRNLTSKEATQAAFEKSCRLIRLIWSPLLPFVYLTWHQKKQHKSSVEWTLTSQLTY